jgi:hypothetical protein
MTNLWHSFIAHWANWLIPFVTWVFGTVMGATFRWFYPSRKEWKEERHLKAEQRIEESVLDAMKRDASHTLPIPRDQWFEASDIVKALGIEVDAAFDSLGRLERKGRVRRGGTNIRGRAPSWTLNPRQ